ncbi:hypothetical protein [Mycobacterium sp.]|uniref:hypothetical protein n=1 Tax=Mycobacterium sp. TaxID=1785 RepID=UPI002CD7F9D2|nr:hypothetical protein [Mycobacterium sp.]HTY33361.1 hypothetical protein [Mycobacterium sp.]
MKIVENARVVGMVDSETLMRCHHGFAHLTPSQLRKLPRRDTVVIRFLFGDRAGSGKTLCHDVSGGLGLRPQPCRDDPLRVGPVRR